MNCETSHSGNYIIYTDGSYKQMVLIKSTTAVTLKLHVPILF